MPALFGAQWSDVVSIFPTACLGTLLVSTAAYPSVGYLFAANRPGAVLRASIASGVSWVLATACLLPFLGVAAIGIGFAVACVAECAVVAPLVYRATGARMMRPVIRPLIAGLVGTIPGWLVANERGDFLGGVAGGALAGGLTVAALTLLARGEMSDLLHVVSHSVRSAFGRTHEEPTPI